MATTTAQQVGANVRAEAARVGLTGSALAAAVNLSQSGMSRRLSGSLPFSITELVSVAEHLGVDVATLIPTRTVSAA